MNHISVDEFGQEIRTLDARKRNSELRLLAKKALQALRREKYGKNMEKHGGNLGKLGETCGKPWGKLGS